MCAFEVRHSAQDGAQALLDPVVEQRPFERHDPSANTVPAHRGAVQDTRGNPIPALDPVERFGDQLGRLGVGADHVQFGQQTDKALPTPGEHPEAAVVGQRIGGESPARTVCVRPRQRRVEKDRRAAALGQPYGRPGGPAADPVGDVHAEPRGEGHRLNGDGHQAGVVPGPLPLGVRPRRPADQLDSLIAGDQPEGEVDAVETERAGGEPGTDPLGQQVIEPTVGLSCATWGEFSSREVHGLVAPLRGVIVDQGQCPVQGCPVISRTLGVRVGARWQGHYPGGQERGDQLGGHFFGGVEPRHLGAARCSPAGGYQARGGSPEQVVELADGQAHRIVPTTPPPSVEVHELGPPCIGEAHHPVLLGPRFGLGVGLVGGGSDQLVHEVFLSSADPVRQRSRAVHIGR